jgi:hypothetical protein
MADDYTANQGLIRIKDRLRAISAIVGGAILLTELAAGMLQ